MSRLLVQTPEEFHGRPDPARQQQKEATTSAQDVIAKMQDDVREMQFELKKIQSHLLLMKILFEEGLDSQGDE